MSRLIFIVPNAEVRTVHGKGNNRDRTWRVQRIGLQGGDGLTTPFEVFHGERDTPYPPGEYELDIAKSVYVNKQGNLAISPRLIAVAKTAKA